MSTSNGETARSLVTAIERMLTRQRKVAEELARRAAVIEQLPPRSRRRTWVATKNEILGRPW